jgi:hypothetical protein
VSESGPIEIVALGRDYATGDKPCLIVQSRERYDAGLDLFKDASLFIGAPSIIPGGIYQANGTIVDGRVTSLGLKSLRLIKRIDQADAVRCEIRDAAFTARKASEAQARKLKSETALASEVRALKAHYRKLHFTDREGFWLAMRRELGA